MTGRCLAGFVWWEFVLKDVGIGLATGLLVAWVAARLMPRDRGTETATPNFAYAMFAKRLCKQARRFWRHPTRANPRCSQELHSSRVSARTTVQALYSSTAH